MLCLLVPAGQHHLCLQANSKQRADKHWSGQCQSQCVQPVTAAALLQSMSMVGCVILHTHALSAYLPTHSVQSKVSAWQLMQNVLTSVPPILELSPQKPHIPAAVLLYCSGAECWPSNITHLMDLLLRLLPPGPQSPQGGAHSNVPAAQTAVLGFNCSHGNTWVLAIILLPMHNSTPLFR